MASKNEIDMLNGPILGKIFKFAIPLILSSLLQAMYNAADIAVIGRFAGTDSLAAVGSTTYMVNLVTLLFIGLSVGANVVVARLIGEGDKEGVKESVHTSFVLALISGIILILIQLLFMRTFLEILKTPADVIDKSVLYLNIYFIGMPSMMVYNFGAAILRAFGDTKRPLYYLTFSGFFNVVLNVIFTAVLKMDVVGVALATVISQTVSAVLVVRCFLKTDSLYKLEINKLKIHKDKAIEIIRVGVPSGISTIVFSFANLVIQSEVNSFGAAVISGNSVATSVETFLVIFLGSIQQAAVTFTSQNLGAKQYDRIKKIAKECIIIVVLMGFIMGNLVSIFSKPLASFYASDPEVIKYAQVRMNLVGPIYFLYGAIDTFTGLLRGIGKSFASMWLSMISICGTRIIYVLTYYQQFKTYEMLYVCFPLSWIVALVLEVAAFVYFFRKLLRDNRQN